MTAIISLQRPRVAAAFSLLEMLVAMAVLALMMLMLFGLFDAFFGSLRQTKGTMQSFEEARGAATLIGRELGASLVRTNRDRYLNFKVEGDANMTAVYFATPDGQLESTTNMSFVSHLAYFWKKEDAAVYRAAYNTALDSQLLLATASSDKNTNYAANQSRLKKMTLAYRSGSPYAWTSDALMVKAMETATNSPVLKDVASFEVRCYDAAPSTGPTAQTNWDRSDALPYYIELRLGLVEGEQRRKYEQTGATNLLRPLVITVPMLNRGVNDNRY